MATDKTSLYIPQDGPPEFKGIRFNEKTGYVDCMDVCCYVTESNTAARQMKCKYFGDKTLTPKKIVDWDSVGSFKRALTRDAVTFERMRTVLAGMKKEHARRLLIVWPLLHAKTPDKTSGCLAVQMQETEYVPPLPRVRGKPVLPFSFAAASVPVAVNVAVPVSDAPHTLSEKTSQDEAPRCNVQEAHTEVTNVLPTLQTEDTSCTTLATTDNCLMNSFVSAGKEVPILAYSHLIKTGCDARKTMEFFAQRCENQAEVLDARMNKEAALANKKLETESMEDDFRREAMVRKRERDEKQMESDEKQMERDALFKTIKMLKELGAEEEAAVLVKKLIAI